MECYVCGYDIGNALGMCGTCRETRHNRRAMYLQERCAAGERASAEGAGFWLRLFAYCIDIALIKLTLILITFLVLQPLFGLNLLEVILRQFEFSTGESLFSRSNSIMGVMLGWLAASLFGFILVGASVSLLYQPLFESSSMMATPGKWLLGLRVVDRTGQQLRFGHALIRFLAKMASWLSLGIGFIMIGIHPKNQGLHDVIADTRVMKTGRCTGTTLILAALCLLSILLATSFLEAGIRGKGISNETSASRYRLILPDRQLSQSELEAQLRVHMHEMTEQFEAYAR